MAGLQNIYDKSPIFFQNIMTSVKGYVNARNRYTKRYYEYREFLKDFDTWTLEEKLEYQRKQMIDFINFAYNNNKFYHSLYKNIDISSIQTIEDLKKLPIVDKEMLRTNIANCTSQNCGPTHEGHTGGTTGKSLSFQVSRDDLEERMAMLDHFKARVGYDHLKMTRATFNGKHIVPPDQKKKIFWRYNKACKQMIFSSFHISEDIR